MIRDRVQTLEDHLKGSKKKLTQVKTGRPAIRSVFGFLFNIV